MSSTPHDELAEPSVSAPVSDATASSLQRIGLGVWGALAVGGLVVAVARPDLLDPDTLHGWFASARAWMLPLFVVVCVLRVLLFVPSSTMLFTAILFMDPIEALVLTTVGFVLATALVYYGAAYLGLEAVFARRYPEAVERVRLALGRYGEWIVIGWAFFPAVPTDAISAVAGAARMPWWRFIVAVTVGQTILAVPIAFGGEAVLAAWFG